MHGVHWIRDSLCSAGGRRLACCLLAALAASGCTEEEKAEVKSAAEPPTMELVQPQVRTIKRVVGQPSFVEAYERTMIYPKVTGYIEKCNVDIGDKVKKGDVLCTLYVPELREDWETKKATVVLDQERVDLAEKIVEVAEADVEAAEARLLEAQRMLAAYKAEVDRWDSEVKRLRVEVKRTVVAPQILLESENQLKSDTAKWDAQKATVAKAKAQLDSAKAALREAQVDVKVAKARVKVAESDAKRLEAWVGYLTIPAPYDGVITGRNANSWDFVLPSTGDPSADNRSPHLSPSGKAAPIYMVDRTDIVRIFVDIPEQDAAYVQVGTKAKVQIRAYRDQWIPAPGGVTRTSWALNFKSRTLRAEIDLPNDNGQILPGMYAYGKVIIERPNVRALPASALVRSGEKTYYWKYENGHAVRVEVQTGVSDGKWTEVTSRQLTQGTDTEDYWTPINGSEQVLLGDLSLLTEGCPVRLSNADTESRP